MPFTRPAEISDRISLGDKNTALNAPFVSEYGAVDSVLARIINEFSPNKHRVSFQCPQYNGLSRPYELTALPAIFVPIGAVVAFIKGETGSIAVLREPPVSHIYPCSFAFAVSARITFQIPHAEHRWFDPYLAA